MNCLFKSLFCFALICTVRTQAQLAVTVSSPKVIGQKAIVTLEMKNAFSENIKSARASCFLLDEQGTMVGQSAKWVINANLNKTGLTAGATNEFNFVITSSQPFTTTNLTAKVNFSRVVMENGQVVDVNKNIQIQNPK
jgi:hypothetical protein